MASGVIDGFEMVEVEEHHADVLALPAAPFQRVSHPVLEQAPVGQAGQVVVHGLVSEGPFGCLLLGYVADDLRNAGHAAPSVAEGGQADRDLDSRAVLADAHRFHSPDDFARPGPGQQLSCLALAVMGDEHGQRSAKGLFFVPAKQLFRSVVPNLDDLVGAGADDGLVTLLGDRGQHGLALHRAVALGLCLCHHDVELAAIVARKGPRLERDLESPVAVRAHPPSRCPYPARAVSLTQSFAGCRPLPFVHQSHDVLAYKVGRVLPEEVSQVVVHEHDMAGAVENAQAESLGWAQRPGSRAGRPHLAAILQLRLAGTRIGDRGTSLSALSALSAN